MKTVHEQDVSVSKKKFVILRKVDWAKLLKLLQRLIYRPDIKLLRSKVFFELSAKPSAPSPVLTIPTEQTSRPFLVLPQQKAVKGPGLLTLCYNPIASSVDMHKSKFSLACPPSLSLSLSLFSSTFPGLYLLCKGNRGWKREEMYCCNVGLCKTRRKRYTNGHEWNTRRRKAFRSLAPIHQRILSLWLICLSPAISYHRWSQAFFKQIVGWCSFTPLLSMTFSFSILFL